MSTSPLHKKINLVSFEVSVGGNILEDGHIYTIEAHNTVNRVPKATIKLLDGDRSKSEFKLQNDIDFTPGNEIEIKAGYRHDNNVIFKGIIQSTGIEVKPWEHSLLVVHCADTALKSTLRRKSVIYANQTDSDIIYQILSDNDIECSVESTSLTNKELVQYDCTDWDFVMARAEASGKIVVSDLEQIHVKAPSTDVEDFTVKYGETIIRANLHLQGQHQYQSVESLTWNMQDQKRENVSSSEPSVNNQGSVDGQSLAGNFGNDIFEIHSSAPIETDAMTEWANGILLKSRLSKIRGTIHMNGVANMLPDTVIKVEGLGRYLEGDAYISGVRHILQTGNWMTELTIGLEAQRFVESHRNVASPVAGGLVPGIQGIYIGTVLQIDKDPDGNFRIKVDIPVIGEEGKGIWARFSNLYSTGDSGTFFFPETEDEVVVGFINGDPTYPVILGTLFNQQKKAPFTPESDNNTKGIITREKLKLLFEEEDKNIVLETPNGNTIILSDKDKKITIKDEHDNKIEMSSSGILFDSAKNIELKAKQNITIKSDSGKVEVKAGSELKMEGQTVKQKSNGPFEAQGAMMTLKATGINTIKGAMVKIN